MPGRGESTGLSLLPPTAATHHGPAVEKAAAARWRGGDGGRTTLTHCECVGRTGQAVHADALPSANVPRSQATHADASGPENVPLGQPMHVTCAASAALPAGQAVQLPGPGRALAEPGGHGSQPTPA